MKTWHVLFLGATYALCNVGPSVWAEMHKYDIMLECVAGVEYSHLANGALMMNLDTNGRPVPCEAQPNTSGLETRL
jgi:hypothetical protein